MSVAKKAPERPMGIYNQKLTDRDVIEMRKNYAPGDKEHGLTAYARKFECSKITIWNALTGRTFKHIPLEKCLVTPRGTKGKGASPKASTVPARKGMSAPTTMTVPAPRPAPRPVGRVAPKKGKLSGSGVARSGRPSVN